jgi:hypothetical protein
MSRKDRALLGCTQSVISVGELRKVALSRCRRATTHFARAHSVIAVFGGLKVTLIGEAPGSSPFPAEKIYAFEKV